MASTYGFDDRAFPRERGVAAAHNVDFAIEPKQVAQRRAKHPNRAGKKILPNLLKHDLPKNISSIVEAKRLGKHDDNSVRIHVAQGGCGYEDLRFFSPVPLHGRL